MHEKDGIDNMTKQNADQSGPLPRDGTRPSANQADSDEQPAFPKSTSMEKIYNDLGNIWTSIVLLSQSPPRTILICSATRGEGCTATSSHFSLYLALTHGLRVLCVNTDVSSTRECFPVPKATEYFGLAAHLEGRHPLPSLILPTAYPNLFVLPAGSDKSGPGARDLVFTKRTLEDLVSYCNDHFDITIFNGQPVTSHPSVIELARLVDQVVLVCRYGNSRREVSRLAVDRLKESGVTRIGAILTDRRYPIPAGLYRILK